MKKHSMPEMKEGGVNVTPLIDIIMCLIIFFMLVTKIGVSRGELKSIELPKTIMGKEIKDFASTLTLNVQPSGGEEPQVTTMVNGVSADIKVTERNGSTVRMPLQDILKEFKKTHTNEPKVIIRADKDLAYSQLEQVLLACATAEISNVAYETKEGTDTGSDTPPAAASAQ